MTTNNYIFDPIESRLAETYPWTYEELASQRPDLGLSDHAPATGADQ